MDDGPLQKLQISGGLLLTCDDQLNAFIEFLFRNTNKPSKLSIHIAMLERDSGGTCRSNVRR